MEDAGGKNGSGVFSDPLLSASSRTLNNSVMCTCVKEDFEDELKKKTEGSRMKSLWKYESLTLSNTLADLFANYFAENKTVIFIPSVITNLKSTIKNDSVF